MVTRARYTSAVPPTGTAIFCTTFLRARSMTLSQHYTRGHMARIPNLSRREWLATTLSLAAAPLALPAIQRVIGVQLYTVRGTLMKDQDHVLKTIADIGYKEIEGNNRLEMIQLVPKIKEYGMSPVSCHV